MKLMLNSTKPIYWNKKKKIFRCGNFPDTGKYIEYVEEVFADIFELMTNFIDKEKLEKIILSKYSIDKKDFEFVINHLIEQNFVITMNKYKKLMSSKRYNRQDMYFYMLSGELKSVNDYKNKKILILGLGGIGSIVAELLVRAGFLNFEIIDYDRVELSNLIRQTAYYYQDVGNLKTSSLMKRMISINSECHILCKNITILSEQDVSQNIMAADFVICTLDKPIRLIRRIINNLCIKYNKPVIFAGFAEHVGMVGPFVVPSKSACLSCIANKQSEKYLNNVINAPSFGPLCNIVASIVSSEVINYYVKFKSSNLIGCTLMINMFDYSTNLIRWKKNESCKVCGDINDSQ